MEDKIYTIPEVAEYLKISKSKAYYLAQAGEIPVIRIGRNIRMKESDLQAWLLKKYQPILDEVNWIFREAMKR